MMSSTFVCVCVCARLCVYVYVWHCYDNSVLQLREMDCYICDDSQRTLLHIAAAEGSLSSPCLPISFSLCHCDYELYIA
jgi:hypothetical protein